MEADKKVIITKANSVGFIRASFKSDRLITMAPVYEIIVLGNSNAGKSSLLSSYVKGEVPKKSQPTEGVEFLVKTVMEPSFKAKLRIWDTAGQKRFKDILRNYYTNIHGALLVYDIHNRESFEAAQEWTLELKARKVTPKIVIALVGNQADVPENRAVTTEEARRFAERNELIFLETSASSNLNINKCFIEVAIAIKKGRVCCCCLDKIKSHWYL